MSGYITRRVVSRYLSLVDEIAARLPPALMAIVIGYSPPEDGVWRLIYGLTDGAHASLICSLMIGYCWISPPAPPLVGVNLDKLGALRYEEFMFFIAKPVSSLDRFGPTAAAAIYTQALYWFICVTQQHLAPASFKKLRSPAYYEPPASPRPTHPQAPI
jgi:hypothetical protein